VKNLAANAKKHRGVALIIVLLILALVSVLATEMGSRLQLQVKRASNIKDSNQAYWYAMGAEQYARKSIQYLIQNSDGVIHLNQDWSDPFTYPITGGGIEAQLIDLQSCFNINSLLGGEQSSTSSSERRTALESLIENINGDLSSYDIETFSDSIMDWLDSDSTMRDQGAEDSEYESKQFPYLAANNMMAHKSELRLINGVSTQWLDSLLKQVCVIPNVDEMKINVNTIDEDGAPLLAALTGLDLADALALITSRPTDGFETAAEFLAEDSITALSMAEEREDWFDVTTSYFLLKVKTTYNNATFNMVSVLSVDESENVRVLRREFGTL
jgi:general secretion pathway protein K